MTLKTKLRLQLAALAAASLFTVPAMGQIRANQDGHANDGSNRVGSGGYNTSNGGTRVSGDQIIYGDVTGGREFTGPIHEPDPKSFFGPSAGRITDNFVRGSSAAPQPYQPSFSLSDPQPFYGMARAVAPPSGSERIGFTGSYLGTGVTSQTPLSMSSDLTTGLDLQTQQLGQSNLLGNTTHDLQDALGQVNLNGPLEAQTGANVFAGSPLYGIRSSLANGMSDDSDTQSLYGVSNGSAANRSLLQNPDMQRMRNDIQQQQQNADQQQPNGQSPNNQPGNLTPQNLNRPLEAPENNSLNPRLNASPLNSPNLANSVNTQQGVQARSTLTPARPQNDQFDLLKQRLERYQNPQMTAILNSQRDRKNLDAARARAAVNSPTSRPSSGLMPPTSAQPQTFEPLAVTSLATGVKAKGMHDLLQSAEDLMREGKFQSAIEKYNAAEQVDPNSAIVGLGRANAELGAGYYHQSSVDLHQVFESEPALLMGRYNLKDWMDPKRIEFIEKELNDLAAADTKQEMPVFLLAYLAYNSGEVDRAKDYLAEARKRAGDSDPLLAQLEGHWFGSAAETTAPKPADLNK
jgi:hypothetical protein